MYSHHMKIFLVVLPTNLYEGKNIKKIITIKKNRKTHVQPIVLKLKNVNQKFSTEFKDSISAEVRIY